MLNLLQINIEILSIDINECDNKLICGNENNCINTNGSYRCECSSDWSGIHCQNSVYCSTRYDGLYPHYECGKAFNCTNNNHSIVACKIPGTVFNLTTGECINQKHCKTLRKGKDSINIKYF